MRLFVRILKIIKGRYSKLSYAIYWLRFATTDAPLLRKCEFGEGTILQVPLRSCGKGTLSVGKWNCFGYGQAPRLGSGEIMLQPRGNDAVIRIGNGNFFSNNVSIISNGMVSIGDNCRIGDLVQVIDCDFHEINPATRNLSDGDIKPVSIGNNVWLGSRVMILKGVTIGDNSVVAASSVVTRSIPPNTLAAGMPARAIGSLG